MRFLFEIFTLPLNFAADDLGGQQIVQDEKDTGRHIVCNVEGFPYKLIWSALAKPVRFVCIEPWHSLPSAENDPQEWNERAAAVCLAPGKRWSTTLSTTVER